MQFIHLDPDSHFGNVSGSGQFKLMPICTPAYMYLTSWRKFLLFLLVSAMTDIFMMETVCENILHVYLSAFFPSIKGVLRKSSPSRYRFQDWYSLFTHVSCTYFWHYGIHITSVMDPDPYVFGPPGSVIILYGSGFVPKCQIHKTA